MRAAIRRQVPGIPILTVLWAGFVALNVPAASPGSAFTYQGSLTFEGSPVTDTCDFRFSLWDSADATNQVGREQTIVGVAVSNGLFTVELNGAGSFGATAFGGEARWLQVAVRRSTGSKYTVLSPLQPITPTPYALATTSPPVQRGEAVAIHLHRDSGGTQYIVPAGKMLMLGQILFNDTWRSSGDPLQLSIQHSTNPSGPVWNTTVTYYAGLNTLQTPLLLPEGKAAVVPYNNNILHKVFLYGRLMDMDQANPVAIHLHRDTGGAQYVVPAGKMLLVNHVLFNETWRSSGEPMELTFQHSINPSGPVWNTTQTFYAPLSTLQTPIAIPEGNALLAPYNGNILHKVFAYGRLIDAGAFPIE